MASGIDVVTGAFGYTGQHIARKLLESGRQIRTLTGRTRLDHALSGMVEIHPYDFQHPDRMVEALRGAETLYNTYWVRFPRGEVNYDSAVRNNQILFRAAAEAGITRIVHLSITNPSEASPYAYFRGKARVEKSLQASGVPYSILRPTVVFGHQDILINNIAWMIRKFPVFVLPGSSDCLIQPIHVEDLASIAVAAGAASSSLVLDAVGPETFSYRELVHRVAWSLGRRIRVMKAPIPIVYAAGAILGWVAHDVVLTYEELEALADNLLISSDSPTGTIRFTEWLDTVKHQLGVEYRSELQRHFER